jgi:large subunit ribosomal protein L25
MADQVSLAVRPRPGNGKGEARSLRQQGRVPAVAYGSGLSAMPLSVDARDLYHALRTDAGTNAIIQMELDGETHLTLAREIHRHPVRREILHVDFVTVNRDVKVTVDVVIHLVGDAPGVDEGGVLDQVRFTVPIEVLPLEVPESFELDVSDMQMGDVKRVDDLVVPAGVTVLDDPEWSVVTLNAPQVEEVPEDTETTLVGDEEALVGEEAELGDEAAAETDEE